MLEDEVAYSTMGPFCALRIEIHVPPESHLEDFLGELFFILVTSKATSLKNLHMQETHKQNK